MAVIRVASEKCKGCRLCIQVCPRACLRQAGGLNQLGYDPAEFDKKSSCSGCCQCAIICPETCIEVYQE